MTVVERTAVLIAALATIALAQERREPIRGSAQHTDGTPWVGATVHLLSRPMPHDERIGTADEIASVSDDKGRFTVSLLPGRQYLAWAVEELGDERYRASFPLERVIAGRPLELMADEPRSRRKLTFAGLDAWVARGEVKAHLMTTTEPRIVVTATLTGDHWLLPPMPGRHAELQITSQGLPFFQWPRDVDLRPADGTVWKLPEPRAVRLRVTDPRGAPIVGAELSVGTTYAPDGLRDASSPVVRTDATGSAIVVLALPAKAKFGWHNYAFNIRARGCSPVGNIAEVELLPDHDAERDPPAMTLKMAEGEVHDLRLLCGARPMTTPVICGTHVGSVGGMAFNANKQVHTVPDSNGALVIHRSPGHPAILVGPTAALQGHENVPTPLHPLALLGIVDGNEKRGSLTFDLDALEPRVFTVTADGIPQHAARLALLVRGGDELLQALPGLVTDRTGRIAALLPPGLEVTAVAWTDTGFAVADKVFAKSVALELAAMRSLPGTVVGKAGEPIAFATVQFYVQSTANKESAALAAAITMLQVPTRRDGSFTLPLFPGTRYSLRGVATPEGDHYLERQWTVGQNDPDEVALDLGKER